MEALAFGAGIRGPGYHMLVIGREGTGRRTAVRAKLQEFADKAERPADWVYVSSFDPTGGFRALKLPAGTAKPFAEKMAHAIDQLADALPAAFAADDYDLKRRTIEEEFRFSREDALEALRREAEAQNIALLRTPAGIAVAPVLEGKVVKTDVFNSVPESLRREVETKIAALEAEIEAILAERPDAEKERRARLVALNEQMAGRHVRAALDDIKAEFAEVAGVESYLKAAARDLVRNAGLFVAAAGTQTSKLTRGAGAHPRFARYAVHVMATTSAAAGVPRSCRRPTRPMPISSGASSLAPAPRRRATSSDQARRPASRQRRLSAHGRRRATREPGDSRGPAPGSRRRGDPLRSAREPHRRRG